MQPFSLRRVIAFCVHRPKYVDNVPNFEFFDLYNLGTFPENRYAHEYFVANFMKRMIVSIHRAVGH